MFLLTEKKCSFSARSSTFQHWVQSENFSVLVAYTGVTLSVRHQVLFPTFNHLPDQRRWLGIHDNPFDLFSKEWENAKKNRLAIFCSAFLYTYNDPVMILLTTIFNLRFRIDVFNFSVFSSFDVNSFDFGVIFFADDRLVHDGLGGLGYVWDVWDISAEREDKGRQIKTHSLQLITALGGVYIQTSRSNFGHANSIYPRIKENYHGNISKTRPCSFLTSYF